MKIQKKYIGKSLDELNKEENDYYRIHGRPTELDFSINDINRVKIEAFAREKDACYLAKFHLRHGARFNPDNIFVRYEGQEVYNFEYDFALPSPDEAIASLIRLNQDPANKGRDVAVLHEKICARLDAIGGILLHWT